MRSTFSSNVHIMPALSPEMDTAEGVCCMHCVMPLLCAQQVRSTGAVLTRLHAALQCCA